VVELEGDSVNSSPELWFRPGDELANDAVGSVPGEDLADPVIDVHREAVGGDGHVAEDEAVGEGRRTHRELGESVIEPPLISLDGRTRVVRDEIYHQVVNAD
jgi:hypothetical protein